MKTENNLLETYFGNLIRDAVRKEMRDNGDPRLQMFGKIRLTRKCAAHFLGVRSATIANMVSRGELTEHPWERDGGTYLLLEDLMDFVKFKSKINETATS